MADGKPDWEGDPYMRLDDGWLPSPETAKAIEETKAKIREVFRDKPKISAKLKSDLGDKL